MIRAVALSAAPAVLVFFLGAGFSFQAEPGAAAVDGVGPSAAASGTAPQPYPGGATGCVVPDPTGTGGCVTGATAWLLTQVAVHVHQGPVTCWDAHTWNPASDHPKGKACDYTFGRLGTFPGPIVKARGWALAGTGCAPIRPRCTSAT